MPTMRGVGLRNGTFGRFSPKQRGPQNHFFTAVPRLPHNLGRQIWGFPKEEIREFLIYIKPGFEEYFTNNRGVLRVKPKNRETGSR